MIKEFREFIAKGNMLDLAIGIVIGAAFTTVINSFVKDIITPIIGLAGNSNFDDLQLEMKPGVHLMYGAFLTAVLNFVIVAFVLFLVVKAYNAMKRKQEVQTDTAAAPEIPNDEKLLTEIRDLLKAKG